MSSSAGTKKTDKRKLPMDNEFSTMEHLAKAQAGYIRTVNELREKVAELEGNKLVTYIRDKLSKLLKHIAELIGGLISGTDKRTLALVAAIAFIAWPRVAPAMRNAIKKSVAALADRLFAQSNIGHLIQRMRMRVAAILVSVLSLIMPSRLTATSAGEGQSGVAQVMPVAARSSVTAVAWTPTLESIAEPTHSIAPIVGQIGQANTMLAALVVPDDCALCDDGATVDCSKTALGRIPGTFIENESELSIGESSATLVSRGTWLHALTRIAADGTEEDCLCRMMDTPTGIATIFSEVTEVNLRRTNIIWAPDAPRTYHTSGGAVLPLCMSNNGLGWLGIRAIADMDRIRSLLNNAGAGIITPIYPQPSLSDHAFTYIVNEGNIADNLTRGNIGESPVSTQRDHAFDGGSMTGFPPIVQMSGNLLRSTRNHAETALVQMKTMPKGTMPPSVGIGRSVKLTGI